MANQAYQSVSLNECSWADLGLTFNIPGGQNLEAVEVEGVKWSGKLDVGESRGLSGGRVMKETAGSETNEASAVFTRSGHAAFMEALEIAAVALNAIRGDDVVLSAVRFDALLQWTPLGDTRIYAVKMQGCRYKGDSNDNKQGNDADTIEVTLNPIRIARKSATGKWLVLR